MAIKIKNVVAYGMLSAEFCIVKRPIAQNLPKQLFWQGCALAQTMNASF